MCQFSQLLADLPLPLGQAREVSVDAGVGMYDVTAGRLSIDP